jgi:hypothetical protein
MFDDKIINITDYSRVQRNKISTEPKKIFLKQISSSRSKGITINTITNTTTAFTSRSIRQNMLNLHLLQVVPWAGYNISLNLKLHKERNQEHKNEGNLRQN